MYIGTSCGVSLARGKKSCLLFSLLLLLLLLLYIIIIIKDADEIKAN